MRFKTILQTSLAVASLALFAPELPAIGSFVSPAAAAVEVEIGADRFYDELAPYGDWVRYRGGYVFVPGDVDERWRPYAYGRWAFTEDYGWMWISDEPFGWATYHYGRWGYGDDIGWYWVPGRVWAPAWVSWRKGPDYVVWAPLPPTYGDDYYDDEGDEDYEVADNDIPDNYWNAVPAASFLVANLAALVFADDDRDHGYHHHRYIEETEPLGPVRYRNKMIMNNGLDARFIENESHQKVQRYKVRETNDFRRAGKRDGDEIEVFDRKVKPRPDAKPMAVKNIEDVEQKHGKRWKRGNGDSQESVSKNKPGSGTPEFGNGQDQSGKSQRVEGQTNTGEKLTKKQRREAEKQKKKQRNQDFSNGNQTGGADNAGQGGNKKKRSQGYSNQDQPGVMDGQNGGNANQGKKKKRNQGYSNQDQPGVMDSQAGENSNQGKKKKRNQGSSSENSQNSDGLSSQQEKKKKRNQSSDSESGSQSQSGNNNKKRKNTGCDPNSGECQ